MSLPPRRQGLWFQGAGGMVSIQQRGPGARASRGSPVSRCRSHLPHAARLLIDHAVNIIDRMVNIIALAARDRQRAIAIVIGIYVAVVVGTIAALVALSVTGSHLATQDAWGHAVIVAVFAVVLPLRARAARAGSPAALRAVGLISAVLFLVNVIEAMIPGLFPLWMRAEMIGIAVIMAVVITLVALERARAGAGRAT